MCGILGVAVVTRFSSNPRLDDHIATHAASTTTTWAEMPAYPPKLPGDSEPEPTVSGTHELSDAAAQSSGQSPPETNPGARSDDATTPPQSDAPSTQSQGTAPDKQRESSTDSAANQGPGQQDPTNDPEDATSPIDDKTDGSDLSAGKGNGELGEQPGSGSGAYGDPESGGQAGPGLSIGTGSAGSGTGPGAAEDEQVFRTCTEAYEAGVAPIRAGEPGYRVELDRDRDGVACELNLQL